MRARLRRKEILGLLFCALVLAPVALASAQEEEAQEGGKYGREARESTQMLWRDAESPLSERERIHHALSRMTFGVTSELIDQVQKQGLENWIDEQIEDGLPEPPELEKRLGEMESLPLTTAQIVKKYNIPRPSLSKKLTPEERKLRAALLALREVPRNELKDTVLLMGVHSNNQLKETALNFWRNHFNIDVSKGNTRYYATDYERTVLREQAMGTFADMLFRQARHPGMLFYLDNYLSRATPKRELIAAGQRAMMESRDWLTVMKAVDIAKMRGINENYARELMELHTLGVDNYYTQDDVIAVADALTGWTIQQSPDAPIEFKFRRDMHDTGSRVVLNTRVPANPRDPEREGIAVLSILVKHPGTADFIAYKLCRYYVNDIPPADLVERVAEAYTSGDRYGDLKAMYSAIFKDPEFYHQKHYQAKFKTPLEFVLSALRVVDAEIISTGGIHKELQIMGEPIYQCEDPTGYYDQADAWRDPGVMANRWRFGLGLGLEQIRGVKIPDSFWEGLEPNNPLQWKEELIKRILPGGCTNKTSDALDDVIAKYARFNPKPEELGAYIVGILIGSPEFQRQ
jgi:uncharacterized protein (DUF1800 family)